jgi:hypothetical protein
MNVDRLSVTVPAEVGQAVRDAAKKAGVSVSTWMSEAAEAKLRDQLLGEALDAWQAEDGPFTEAELEAGAALLRGQTTATRRTG